VAHLPIAASHQPDQFWLAFLQLCSATSEMKTVASRGALHSTNLVRVCPHTSLCMRLDGHVARHSEDARVVHKPCEHALPAGINFVRRLSCICQVIT